MKRLSYLCFILCFQIQLQAQELVGISTRWIDEFTEWEIFTTDEDLTGEIIMRWQSKMDWTQWNFRLGETSGIIRQSFKDDPSQWNLSSSDGNITARVVYKGDFRQWRISNNDLTFTLITKYGNTADEWLIREEQYGIFDIYSSYEGDPREWEIVDEFSEEVPLTLKVMIAFITVFNSSPKM